MLLANFEKCGPIGQVNQNFTTVNTKIPFSTGLLGHDLLFVMFGFFHYSNVAFCDTGLLEVANIREQANQISLK